MDRDIQIFTIGMAVGAFMGIMAMLLAMVAG